MGATKRGIHSDSSQCRIHFTTLLVGRAVVWAHLAKSGSGAMKLTPFAIQLHACGGRRAHRKSKIIDLKFVAAQRLARKRAFRKSKMELARVRKPEYWSFLDQNARHCGAVSRK
jgi:hypothetical protein